MRDWPLLAIYLFFLFGAFARSQAIYWLGRGVASGVLRSRWGDRFDSPQVHKATRSVERWGMPIVPLAFLTVGFQSAVFVAAGMLRVGWLRFTLWTIPGALVWAAIWGGSGVVLAAAVWALAQESPLAAAAIVVVLAVAVTALVLWLRRRREQREAIAELSERQP